MKKNKFFSKFYLVVIYAFLYAPIAVLIIFSFNNSKSRNIWSGFTLKWYEQLFNNELILTSLFNTLLLAIISSVIATIIGTMAAIGISAMKKKQRIFVLNLTYLPIISPEIVTGISLMLTFVLFKLDFGFNTLVLAHITFNVPYVLLNVMPKMRQMDKYLYEAAQDLGCNNYQAFTKVVIPEIMPGIVSGFLMALTYSIDDFVISYFTYGPQSQTLPITIYSMTRKRISPEINALSTIIFFIVLAILLYVNIRDARAEKQIIKSKRKSQ